MQVIPEEFLRQYRTLLSQAHAARYTDEALDNAAAVADRIERMIVVVEECAQLLESTVYHTELSLLHTMRYNLSQSLRLIVYGVDEHTVPPIALYPYHTLFSGVRGRPRIVISVEHVELLRSCGYTWNEVADALQVSRSTIWRRLKEAGIHLQRYSDISDHELDSIVERFQRENPNYGQQLLLGHLKAQGVYVQRRRLRECVQRIDPIRRHLRWQQAISRRTYCVQNSNALWHIDGHHSLVRWRFVVHGGIDGYSRVIVYLACSTDNKAMTVYQLFRKAVEEFGCPSRVRSDKGGENIKVCHFMVSVRGGGRGSHIAGSSVHNQRIERLWRDVYRCVCSTYHQLFYEMEALRVLDPDDECDLFVLHCIFLPRINRSLASFAQAWNLHPLRTEKNWTPRQIMINSMIKESEINQNESLPSDYGVDYEGPLPDNEIGTVCIPETVCPLDEDDIDQFMGQVDTTSYFDDLGVQYFLQCKQVLQALLLNQ